MGIFRALKHRNFRLFFWGQSVSLIGTWMQMIAMAWLVYRLTNSAALLGIVAFAGQIPVFLVSPFSGVFADRWDNRRALIVTQTLAMVQALVLAGLVLTNAITVWQIVLLSFILGLINSFDMTIRQTFVVEIVENKADLGNAIALNSSLVNSARLIGPSLAGVLIAVVGEGICFLLNAVSYLAAIFALLAMTAQADNKKPAAKGILRELKEGIAYAVNFVPVRDVLLLLSLVSLVGMPYTVLMPVFVRDILRGGPETLGFLMAASGFGALFAGLYLASRKDLLQLEKLITAAPIILGAGLVLLAFTRSFLFALIIMLVTGTGMITQIAGSNTLIQSVVADDKRGRVMSFFTFAFVGTAPFGSLLAGGLAQYLGVRTIFFICGLCCLAGALVFGRRLPAIRKEIEPIYLEKGLLTAALLTRPPED